MSSLKIRKVGNSLGVILSREVQEALNVAEGDTIDVTAIAGNKVVLGAHLPHHSQWVFKDTSVAADEQKWLEADLEDESDKAPSW